LAERAEVKMHHRDTEGTEMELNKITEQVIGAAIEAHKGCSLCLCGQHKTLDLDGGLAEVQDEVMLATPTPTDAAGIVPTASCLPAFLSGTLATIAQDLL
jgi:hypothetical protein